MGSIYLGSFVFSDERGGKLSFSFCLVGWLDEGKFYFMMVESLLTYKGVGLSERETARLNGVRRTHSQGHVLACFGN